MPVPSSVWQTQTEAKAPKCTRSYPQEPTETSSRTNHVMRWGPSGYILFVIEMFPQQLENSNMLVLHTWPWTAFSTRASNGRSRMIIKPQAQGWIVIKLKLGKCNFPSIVTHWRKVVFSIKGQSKERVWTLSLIWSRVVGQMWETVLPCCPL